MKRSTLAISLLLPITAVAWPWDTNIVSTNQIPTTNQTTSYEGRLPTGNNPDLTLLSLVPTNQYTTFHFSVTNLSTNHGWWINYKPDLQKDVEYYILEFFPTNKAQQVQFSLITTGLPPYMFFNLSSNIP